MRIHSHTTISFSLGGILALFLTFTLPAGSFSAETTTRSHYERWTNGPPNDPAFFPIAVWLQNPSRAEQYRKAGFNTYVGLWRGPTDDQLAVLEKAGMKVVCSQNRTGLSHIDNPTIIGWMHGDEPDNAQSLGQGKGYGPPIKPEKIIEDYERIRATDPSRPVLLNLGQGVAWDNWIGRGVRRNHPEDYPEYVKGSDIVSFDIYPAVHDKPEVAGNLWYVAHGVERLVKWTGGKKIVWNCIEASRISNTERKPRPHEVRAEVWMSIIHGSRGLIYFVHQFQPVFREASLFDDAELLAAVTRLNHEIAELAPVLNTGTPAARVTVVSENASVPIATLALDYNGATYLFAVAMRDGATKADFTLAGRAGTDEIEVLHENRSLRAESGKFTDSFASWAVHLYRIKPAQKR